MESPRVPRSGDQAACPGTVPGLDGTDVHVWTASLCRDPSAVGDFRRILSPEELRRAERFVFDRDRSRYIQARGTLRMILGGYLEMPAGEIRFGYNEFGKPLISLGTEGDRLCFNLSHSRGAALIAVARGRRVGIDIEYRDQHRAYLDIAEYCFSPSEMKTLHRLPQRLQRAAFFDYWTHKEAYIKALGMGCSYPLREFTVPPAFIEPGRVLAVDDPGQPGAWSLLSLPTISGFSASLVMEGEMKDVLTLTFPRSGSAVR